MALPENDAGNLHRKKVDKNRFMEARNGDSLIQPFQCDICWFRNLHRRSPREDSEVDTRMMAHIRRVNLDLLWSREPATIKKQITNFNKSVKADLMHGLDPVFPKKGPWKIGDDVGFRVALRMVTISRWTGRYHKTHQQYDTICQLRGLFSNMYESSVEGASTTLTLRNVRGESLSISTCPTQSLFFRNFALGCLSRMGKDVRSDRALDRRILHLILKNLESEINVMATSPNRRRWLIVFGCYMLISYVCSLRGNKGFMIDLCGLINHLNDGKGPDDSTHPHVVIPLLGRFKNKISERLHLMLAASVTKSGFKVRRWVEMLVIVMAREKKFEGPAMCEENGEVVESRKINEEFWKQLAVIQQTWLDLIGANEDVVEIFNIRRSLRRGAQSTAREEGVSGPDIDLVNRWRSVESRGGRFGGGSMRDHYTDIRLMRKRLLTYSEAL